MQSAMGTQPAIFKWRQTEPALILCTVRWYLRYSLSLRDVEELLQERGLKADHTTVWRWVQRYAPELEQRLRRYLKPTNKSWRVDETYIRVKGRWCYLYRAIDSGGTTIDFLFSALRDGDAAKRLFRGALSNSSHPQPRVINTDLAPIYGAASLDIKKEGILRHCCRHRPVQYLNNILEQDHRAIKRRVNAKQGFREFQAARRTIQGYEAINMIRKGQVRWLSGMMSSVRSDSSRSSSIWLPEIVMPACPRPSSVNHSELQRIPPIYGSAIPDLKKEGILRRRCRHRPVQYLNNILEQDHRAIKRRVHAKQGFREFQAARRTIQGYEAINMMRKGQVRWVNRNDVRHHIQFINKLFELSA
jgi:transposase, IS6 family